MPELPEVQTVVNQLRPLLVGRTIERAKIIDKQRLPKLPTKIRGAAITGVERVAKEIILELSTGSFLAIHLRMTGRLFVSRPSELAEKKHLRALFDLGEESLLFFDTRRFGTIKFLASLSELNVKGVEPLSDEFTPIKLAGLAKGVSQPVKNFLLRQDKILGLGNIYVCEILFSSKVSPTREVGSLTKKEISLIHRNTRKILSKAIENCGTTFSDFQQTTGETGSFQKFLKVYGRKGEKCSRCREEIEVIKQAGRSTFFCPACQV